MRKETIDKIQLTGIILIASIGILMILRASELSTYIVPKFYDFDISVSVKEDKVSRINNFLIFYDFTQQKGNISFEINRDQKISYIRIDFPSFVNHTTTNVKLFKERNYKLVELDSKGIELNLISNPVGKEAYTTLVIHNINDINLSDTYIIINFKSNIEPNGIFTINHPTLPIGSNLYALQFNLGDKYECSGSCINKDFNIDAEEHALSSQKEIKIRLSEDDTKTWHRFKIESTKVGNLFLSNLYNGFGISLLASAIILLFEFVINKLRDNARVICPLCLKPLKNDRGLKNHLNRMH